MNSPVFIFILIFVLLIYLGLHLFVGIKLIQVLRHFLEAIPAWPVLGILLIFALSLVFARLDLPVVIKGIFKSISSLWLGLFIFLTLYLALGELVQLILRTPEQSRWIISFAAIVLALITAISGYIGASQTSVVTYDVQLKKSLDQELKIVLIADLHLGDTNSEKRLPEIIQTINQQEPDLVVMAGDMFNDDFRLIQNPTRAEELFQEIHATYGVYASLGNHDGGKTLPQMMEFLRRSGVQLLNDESTTINQSLILLGRLDAQPIGGYGNLSRRHTETLIETLEEGLPVIVLEHNPEAISQYDDRVDLILSGHTHKGQVFPGSLITKAVFEVDYGHYQPKGERPQVIVTSGVGTWGLQMRLGTQNEIVVITVK